MLKLSNSFLLLCTILHTNIHAHTNSTLTSSSVSFFQALKQGAERLVAVAQAIMRDVFVGLLGSTGPLGGVRFDVEVTTRTPTVPHSRIWGSSVLCSTVQYSTTLCCMTHSTKRRLFTLQYRLSSAINHNHNHNHYYLVLLSQDDKFDNQPAHGLLPKLLLTPFEQLLLMCTKGLSDANKDIMVGLLADAYCERVEHFISQVSKPLISYHAISLNVMSCYVTSYRVILRHLILLL